MQPPASLAEARVYFRYQCLPTYDQLTVEFCMLLAAHAPPSMRSWPAMATSGILNAYQPTRSALRTGSEGGACCRPRSTANISARGTGCARRCLAVRTRWRCCCCCMRPTGCRGMGWGWDCRRCMCIMGCGARRRMATWTFVEALCLRLEVPLHVHHASVPERVARSARGGAGGDDRGGGAGAAV